MSITPKAAADARKLLSDYRKQERKARGQRIQHKPAKQDGGRDLDPEYLSWLHQWECIACLLIGPGPDAFANIEAAHQKAQDASRGWHKLMGRKVHDRQCVPLCAWHHRIAPNCCDPAQAKFWAMLGVDVIDFATDMYRAFQNGDQGTFVIWDHSHRAMGAAA